MRYLIAILIMCSTSAVIGEDIFKPTGRYAKDIIVEADGQKVRLEKTDDPSRFSFSAKSPDVIVEKTVEIKNWKQKNFIRRGLAYFFSPSCGPCHAWRNNNLERLRHKGYHVWEVDMSIPENVSTYPSVRRLPSFTVNDYSTGERLSDVIEGGIPFEEVERLLGTDSAVRSQVTVPVQQVTFIRDPAKRYAIWGSKTYDMETWQRQCNLNNCPMCIFLDNAQAVYFSSAVPVQTEAPSPQSSSPSDVVDEAIVIANLSPQDVVGELGSGNGMTAIRMAKASGCRVVGVEIDPQKVVESRANIKAAGLSDRITIIEGDVRQFDPADHSITVVYAYLYPELLNEIKPILSSGRMAVCPGHKADGLGMISVGQCWVKKNDS